MRQADQLELAATQCGVCGGTSEILESTRQAADNTHAQCNSWRLTAHEQGWGDATMRIHAADPRCVLQIDNFAYADDLFVSAGVADACLHPSRCYHITVDGPS